MSKNITLVSLETLDSATTIPMGWRSVDTSIEDHDAPFTDADRDWFRKPLTSTNGGSL